MYHLHNRGSAYKHLQFIEWIEGRNLLKLEERDYACHLDLIARNSGIENAQKYIARVPKHFKNEVLYETLLVNWVRLSDIQKAEEIFREIRNLYLPLTVSACNQMILLYKRVARNKVADILMLMEKENLKPSLFTYKLIIDLKGRANDMSGIELVLNEMKASGLEPDFATWGMVARFYIYGGLTEKAEAVISEIEMESSKDKRHAIRSLLHLYAALGKQGEVARIWKLCTEPNLEDTRAVILAWGKLGCIEQAEETFEAMLKTTKMVSSRYYNAMLSVYAENKLMAKGKEFLKRMSSDGCPNSPLTWDVLIKLYINSGEVGKADSFLLNVTEQNPDRRPTYGSYIYLLRAYAGKGDIHNAEKIFHKLKMVGYPGRKPPYAVLLEAYVNAKVQPHGFRERMRADGVHPVKKVIDHLKFLDKLPNGGVPELKG
jgi:pentatricopeptide repeat protein